MQTSDPSFLIRLLRHSPAPETTAEGEGPRGLGKPAFTGRCMRSKGDLMKRGDERAEQAHAVNTAMSNLFHAEGQLRCVTDGHR